MARLAPVETFMAKFVQYHGFVPNDDYFAGLFDGVLTEGIEDAMYAPFTAAGNSNNLLSDYVLVSTPHKADQTDLSRQKMDCAMYRKGSSPPTTGRADWAKVELSIEMKPDEKLDDPFDDKRLPHYPYESEKRKHNLGQIMTYATLVFDRQHRTHHFTVIIFGSMARLVRWDRSGLSFTEKFNYKTEPHKLGKFLWCYARMTPTERGHDPTVSPIVHGSDEHNLMRRRAATPRMVKDHVVDEHARKAFEASLEDDWPWFKITVNDSAGHRNFLVGKPNFIAEGLAGRGTRGYVALDVDDPEGPFVYLKDAWRVNHERIQKEGDILSELNTAKVPNIPTLHCHGDVPGQQTCTQDIWKEVYGEDQACPLKAHHHYRLVVKEVGIPLSEFTNGEELILVLLDCIDAHSRAYKAGFLHRDISAGNILLYPKLVKDSVFIVGLLTDWELAKRVEDDAEEPRQPDRTGTWQFQSALALSDASKVIRIPDELESILYILLYEALRYLPSNCVELAEFMASFFDDGHQRDLEYICGDKKLGTMQTGRLRMNGTEPIIFLREPFKPKPLPTRSSKPAPTADGVAPSTSTSPAAPTVQPGSASGKDDVFSIPPSTMPAVPPALMHPINKVIRDLLLLFKAYYQIHMPDVNLPNNATNVPQVLQGAKALRSTRWHVEHPVPDVIDHPVVPSEVVAETALKLDNHEAFGQILYKYIESENWPPNDKQKDQIDPKYRQKLDTAKRPNESKLDAPASKRRG